MAVVFSLLPRANRVRDWTNDELAELYRVKHALGQANIALEVDRGVTDEGDPWFVFCRYDGEVLVHIARYDGLYRLFSPALPLPLVGATFSELTRSFISRIPEKNEASASSNVIRHPSAVLSLLIVTIFFSIDYLTGHDGRADAAPLAPAPAQAAGRDAALQSVISNMLVSIGDAEAERVLESACLAGQAAVLFIGNGLALLEDAPYAAAATGDSEAVAGALTDVASDHTDVLAPPVNPSPLGASADVASGLAVPAKSVVAATSGQTIAAVATLSAPVATVTPALTAATATAATPAPGVIPVETHGQNVVHLADQMIVLASPAGVDVNLSGDSSVHRIELNGDGSVTLSGLSGNGSQAIEVLGSSAEALSLEFASGATSLKQTLSIRDGGSVTLESISAPAETPGNAVNSAPGEATGHAVNSAPAETPATTVDLTVDSTGNHPNTLNVSDAAVQGVTLNLKIIGSQDLALRESAKVLGDSSLDASGFQGQLTVGVDLSGSADPTTLVGSSDFVVNANGIVALANVPDHATIQVATNLEAVLTQFGASSDLTLGLDLQSVQHAATPVSIDVVKVDGATTLTLNSGGDASVVNKVGALIDSNLQDLKISGSGSLSIGSVAGVTSANNQNIAIDAGQFTGNLSIDVSQIADVANGGRQITIIGGQGNNVLTNSNATEATTFVAGGGRDQFNVAAGAQSVTVNGLHAGDTIVVGGGAASDAVVDATQLPGLSSAYLNSLSLPAAATAASAAAGVAAPHQAVLFDYNSSLYVFIDSSGHHVFDSGADDALVQIVGMSKAVDLSHVFFSA